MSLFQITTVTTTTKVCFFYRISAEVVASRPGFILLLCCCCCCFYVVEKIYSQANRKADNTFIVNNEEAFLICIKTRMNSIVVNWGRRQFRKKGTFFCTKLSGERENVQGHCINS